MVSIVLAILALCLLVVIHEFGHFLVARLCGMRVDRFSVGFGPALWSKKIGETTYQIAAIPLGGYVQIAGLNPEEEAAKNADAPTTNPADPRLYNNQSGWKRFLVVLAGPFINYLFAFLVILGLNLTVGLPTAVDGVMLGQVVEGSAAAKAGLQAKDEIVSVNGISVKDPEQFVSQIQGSSGQPLVVQIRRGAEEKTLTVIPVSEEGIYRIGVSPISRFERQHHGIFAAIGNAAAYPVYLTWVQIQGFKRLFQDKKARDGIGGVVGIVDQLKTQIRSGWVDTLEALALISTALGFFNLLPIPALDGGRLMFLGWEIITRRPVSKKVEQWVHAVGIILLLGLMLLITFRDVLRLIKKALIS